MNKKIIFLSAGIMMSAAAFAQKDKLREATKELETATSLKSNQDLAAPSYTKAKDAIDLAVNHPDTKDKPQTWETKAGIYIGMQENAKLNADNPYQQGIEALKKATELDPKWASSEQAVNLIANAGFYSFNDAVKTYNQSHYNEAYKLFQQTKTLLGEEKDKRFILMPIIDTIRAQAVMFMGYTAYYDAINDAGRQAQQLDEAIKNLNLSKASPYLAQESNIYLVLAQAYDKKGDKANQTATIEEGLKKFPSDQNLRALDLNAAISGGSKDEAVKKLQEAIDKDPKNPDLYMNLGILNYTIAYPSDGSSNAESAAYASKAEANYKKTVELAPENGTYNFQLGSLYYNNASRILTTMNTLGTSKADQAKYDLLSKDKDAEFAKALPYLEKARDIFNARRSKLTGEEMKEFANTLVGLKEIYTRIDQPEKSAAAKKLLNEINQ
jgi:predicted Zn-dependent protease